MDYFNMYPVKFPSQRKKWYRGFWETSDYNLDYADVIYSIRVQPSIFFLNFMFYCPMILCFASSSLSSFFMYPVSSWLLLICSKMHACPSFCLTLFPSLMVTFQWKYPTRTLWPKFIDITKQIITIMARYLRSVDKIHVQILAREDKIVDNLCNF